MGSQLRFEPLSINEKKSQSESQKRLKRREEKGVSENAEYRQFLFRTFVFSLFIEDLNLSANSHHKTPE